MEPTTAPLYKQPIFWVGLAVLAALAVWFGLLSNRGIKPAPSGEIKTREDLLKALSADRQIPVSDQDRENLAQKLSPDKPAKVTPEERNKLLELLK